MINIQKMQGKDLNNHFNGKKLTLTAVDVLGVGRKPLSVLTVFV